MKKRFWLRLVQAFVFCVFFGNIASGVVQAEPLQPSLDLRVQVAGKLGDPTTPVVVTETTLNQRMAAPITLVIVVPEATFVRDVYGTVGCTKTSTTVRCSLSGVAYGVVRVSVHLGRNTPCGWDAVARSGEGRLEFERLATAVRRPYTISGHACQTYIPIIF